MQHPDGDVNRVPHSAEALTHLVLAWHLPVPVRRWRVSPSMACGVATRVPRSAPGRVR